MKANPRNVSIAIFFLAVITISLIAYNRRFSLPSVEISQEKIEEIDHLINSIYENGQFSGAMLVSVGGDVIYQKAFGYANLEWKVPNALDTKFRIASATKPFTSMLILQLAEEGKLKLEGKLTDYLPEFPPEKGKDITIHQLLTHTSGIIGESRIPDLEDIERLYYTKERLLKYISEKELAYRPGKGREYSNFGFFLLGMVIEKVSGKTYSQLLQEKICAPAGMKNTIPDVNVPLINKRASGYDHDYFTGPQNAAYLDMSYVFSYGHLLSTVNDLYLWDKALYLDKLLSERSKELFFNRFGWLPFRYPYGKHDKRILCSNLDGSINGFGSHIQRIEKDRIFIAILRNMKERNNQIVIKWPSFMASPILAILYNEEYDLPRKSAAYEIFSALIKSGIQAAAERYDDIKENRTAQFYFTDEEFLILGEELYEAHMLEEALAYLKLDPDNKEVKNLVSKIEKEIK